ncbi:MAG: AAA family ATPase [bacterium]
MDYIKLLNLTSEPFSNSPDPKFLFHSKRALVCLQQLELSIRLKRGLSIVIGDVGTGKTTLSRSLIQRFQAETDQFKFYLIIDPCFISEEDFLINLLKIFNINPPATETALAYKEAIRHFLLYEGIKKGRVIILIVDEAQKISDQSLEVLRSLLNFETNEFKLLQLVIFAQSEFYENIKQKINFSDRIDTLYTLKPLDEEDTRRMIEFRLRQAGWTEYHALFTPNAMRLIYLYTQGYPRKIITTCHHCLLAMLISKKNRVDTTIVNETLNNSPERYNEVMKKNLIKEKKINALSIGVISCLIIFLFISIYWGVEHLSPLISSFDLAGKPSSSVSKLSPIYSFSPALPPKPNFSVGDNPIERPDKIGNTWSMTSSFALHKIPQSIEKKEILNDNNSKITLKEKQSNNKDLKTTNNNDLESLSSSETNNQDKSHKKDTQKELGNNITLKIEKFHSENIEEKLVTKIKKDKKEHNNKQEISEIQKQNNDKIVKEIKLKEKPVVPKNKKRIPDRSSYMEVIVKKGDFIHKMAQRVYKTPEINDAILEKIAFANPNIPNINKIYIGQRIQFPYLKEFPGVKEKKELGGYSIRVGYFFNIDEAKQCIKNLASHGYQAYMDREKFSDLGDRYKIELERVKEEEQANEIVQKIKELKFPYAKVIKLD